MKEKILEKAGEIFVKYGVKRVTMDDIANSLSISKKTIYKYFRNKEKLIDETATYMHAILHENINQVCELGYNAIEENFRIKEVFKEMFQNLNDSPVYQLKKYYPKTYDKIIAYEFTIFKDCITNNIEKGINEGLYIENIDKDLISKFYFTLAMAVHDTNLFLSTNKNLNQTELAVLEYHTRAIATPKGITILEEQLAKSKN